MKGIQELIIIMIMTIILYYLYAENTVGDRLKQL